MSNKPLIDTMKLGDAHLQVSVRCAQCNEPVQAGITHTCKPKPKESKNEQNSN